MNGTYSLELVALSVIVAVVASYTALDLAGRVSSASRRRGRSWLFAGAFALGGGIWSMHFIGMLAFRLPVPIAFDASITLVSMAIAVLVSGFALFAISKPQLKTANLTLSATLMGIGISAMHYTGMMAMRMSPPIHYDPPLFVASVIIAIGASLAALWIAFQLRSKQSGLAVLAKLGSATVMGLAISGMHYTGMAAAEFAPGSVCLAAESGRGMDSGVLAVTVGVTTLFILVGTLIISSIDAHSALHIAKLAESLHVANQELRSVALYDSLTGLPNRLLLQDRLEQAAKHGERSSKMFALMFVDLDRFKSINDNFGHRIGDLLLQQVGARFSAAIRKEDTVARTGGDEFVVVLSELSAKQEAAIVGRKLIAELSRPFHVESHTLEISGSVGIAIYPEDGREITALIAGADAAMYQIKRAGRNGVGFFNAETASLPSSH